MTENAILPVGSTANAKDLKFVNQKRFDSGQKMTLMNLTQIDTKDLSKQVMSDGQNVKSRFDRKHG